MRKLLFLCLSVLLVLGVIAIFMPSAIAPNINGTNYRNVSVWTHVNITNSKPEVLGIAIFDSTNASLRNVTLTAGGLKSITCNASVRDWNGFNDIVYVNATLYYINNQSFNPDDNNTHYTNASCTLNSSTGTYTGYYQCIFPNVQYYANNGTWYCNVTDMDTFNTTGNLANTTVFYPVYALNVSDGIDYGGVAVQDFSPNVTANISNIGNMAINITVQGYGANLGDGLAMNCSLGGNITVANERFSIPDLPWASMTPLSNGPQNLTGLTMPKSVNGAIVTNTTHWELYVDSTNNPGGSCSGYVLFMAQAS